MRVKKHLGAGFYLDHLFLFPGYAVYPLAKLDFKVRMFGGFGFSTSDQAAEKATQTHRCKGSFQSFISVSFLLLLEMNDDKNDDNIDLNGESRAKRLFVSIEPLPDRRVYRIDPRGIETYDEYVPMIQPLQRMETTNLYNFNAE